MKTQKEEKFRVSAKLSKVEKELLEYLADESGRSMSSYLRFLLLQAIDEIPD